MANPRYIQHEDIKTESFLNDTKMNNSIYEMPAQEPSTPPYDSFDDANRKSKPNVLPSHCALQNGLAYPQSLHQKRMQDV